MKRLMIICGLLSCGIAAQAQTCTPNYKAVRQPCVDDTSQPPIKMTIKTEKPEVDYQKRAISVEEIKSKYCMGDRLDAVARKWHINPDSIRVIASNEVSGDRWTEGDLLHGDLAIRWYQRFYCEYTGSVPEYKQKADSNCPIIGMSDENSCFEAKRVSVDPSYIEDQCIYLQPGNDEEAFKKAACLMGAYKAAKESRFNTDFRAIKNALAAYADGAPSEQVRALVRGALAGR